MDTKHKYKLADQQRQKMLVEMGSDPLNISDEIAVAKLLLAEALADKNPNLANALLGTIGKLTGQHLSDEIRLRRLISMEDLKAFAQRIAESITRHLAHVPDHESIVDRIAEDFSAGLCDLSKPVLRIGGRDAQ